MTCCTSVCLPSPPTLQPSSTTKLEPSACTLLMTWWAASLWLLMCLLSWFRTDQETFLTLSQQIPQSSPIRLNTRTFGAFIPQVTGLHVSHSIIKHKLLQQFVSQYHGAFSDRQTFPRSDDETVGEDGENSCRHFWTQQHDCSSYWHGDGLRYPTQHHTVPSLCPQLGMLAWFQNTENAIEWFRKILRENFLTVFLKETSVSARVFVSEKRLAGAVTLNKWVPEKKSILVLRRENRVKRSMCGWTSQSNLSLFAQDGCDSGHKLCGRVSGESCTLTRVTVCTMSSNLTN